MRPLVILGSGGLGRQIIGLAQDVEQQTSAYKLLGFLDDGVDEPDVWGVPVLGGDDQLAGLDAHYVIGVGLPTARRRLAAMADAHGREPATLVHSAAWIGLHTSVGAGSLIFETAHVVAGAQVGQHVMMEVNTFAGHDSRIGDHVLLAGGASVGARAVIGDDVMLGIGCIVLGDVVVGDRAVVGAGAVVTKDVPAGAVVVGIPAKETRLRRGRITA
ncbi:NeuD/PglB/VioB family sugar acetyltransferase [Jiangella mangrovi]|uniref:Sugar O-acyltransferase (Sialic acid O-acetyltransferase NeuD family) n=1 Tax=Jiangella mangrovi TaxID=1524084 RepID=A0A7W9LPV1_9ACTN|nr:sugar O-acyltransferase (sialic acid O-acetyltransferase NeuD family) [Jiangella mangrovi]